MIIFKKQRYIQFIFISSLAILIAAFFIQYILGYQPCNLCIIERIPYSIAITILILNHIFKKDQIFYSVLLILIFSFSLIISIYHLGIEQGLINESSVCGSNNADLLTKENILKSLQEINISCKDVTLRIFGLSLTTYNIFISLLMVIVSIKIYLINNDNKK